MSKFRQFFKNLPWIGKVQAAGLMILLILGMMIGYAAFRIQTLTHQIRQEIETQTNLHNVTERLQKTMLREHLGLLEYFVTRDDMLLPMRKNLRRKAFREMTQMLAGSTDSTLRPGIAAMSREVRDYFQRVDRTPANDITPLTVDLRRIERLGDHVLAADDVLMAQERLHSRSALLFEQRMTLWAEGFLVFMLLFALWYGLSLVRPVSELLQAIGRIKNGDFNFQIPVRRKDDMGKLADSFNGMIQNVNLRQQQLIRESVTDGLTGLYNTKHFWTSLRAIAEEAHKTGVTFSLLMIDIDHFKQFNDRHGHEFGNAVIKMTASLIKQNLRESDILARYGGDEFVVILPTATASEGLELAKRIETAAISSYMPSQKTGSLSDLSLSIGGATYLPTHQSLEVLISRTDDALYAAKSSGRACVRWAEELSEKNEEAVLQRLVS